ncbi:hypothetical protein RFI_27242, partial [Reticulomyxa filosa]
AIQYKDWHERVKAFRQLLEDKQIHPDWNWNKVLPIIVQDYRYEAIPKVNDKKKELKQWQTDERTRLDGEMRQKEQLIQQQFVQMLQSKFHQLVKKSYRHVKHILQEEEAYKAVERDALREEWYDRWRDNASEQYRKQKQQEKFCFVHCFFFFFFH